MINGMFHVHSSYSPDSCLSPSRIIKFAIKHHVDILAITDHDTLAGALEAARIAPSNLVVIPGAEYTTEQGHIIGLFLKEDIRSTNIHEVIDAIHSQGGICLLPHPYQGTKLYDDWINKVDIIEVFNSRCSPDKNGSALELALRLSKPILAGVDAHLPWELNNCTVHFQNSALSVRNMLMSSPRQFSTQMSSNVNFILSQLIKGVKLHRLDVLWMNSRALASSLLIKILGLRTYEMLRKVIRQT